MAKQNFGRSIPGMGMNCIAHLLLIFLTSGTYGQVSSSISHQIVCEAGEHSTHTYLESVKGSIKGPAQPRILPQNAPSSDIQVDYKGLPEEFVPAFEFAVSIWEGFLVSEVPITVKVEYKPLAMTTLGITNYNLYKNFPSAPFNDTYYQAALGNTFAGKDIDPLQSDINIVLNSLQPWYTGKDGKVPEGKYDLVTAALHELCHGLGFSAIKILNPSSGTGSLTLGGAPSVFTLFAEDGAGNPVLSYPDNSPEMYRLLHSNNVYLNGPFIAGETQGNRPMLHVPPEPTTASFNHLDEFSYPAGNDNSLMTPALAGAEAVHLPGPAVLGLLKEIGWNIVDISGCDSSLPQLSCSVRAFLEGYFEPELGRMKTTLHSYDLIPRSDPYEKTVTTREVLSVLPDRVVDWVRLELRTSYTDQMPVAGLSAFIREDGIIVSATGSETLRFPGLPEGKYFITLRHRGHLALVTGQAITLTCRSSLIDFTKKSPTTTSLKDIKGTMVLIGGDFDNNGRLDVNDYQIWKSNPAAVSIYNDADGDGNGVINFQDFNLWKRNYTDADRNK